MSGYEFTPEEDQVIDELRKNMLILSVVLFIGGIAALLVGVVEASVLDLIAGAAVTSIGISLFLPTDNFKRITTTAGADIKELMIGFSELDKGWLVVNILTAVYALSKLYMFISAL